MSASGMDPSGVYNNGRETKLIVDSAMDGEMLYCDCNMLGVSLKSHHVLVTINTAAYFTFLEERRLYLSGKCSLYTQPLKVKLTS